MADDTDDTSNPIDPSRLIAGVPMGFIRGGGTPTMAHERQVAEAEADAERRRNEAAAERAVAAVPIEEGGGQRYDNRTLHFDTGTGLDTMHVLLDLLTSGGEAAYDHGEPVQCLADVRVVDADNLALTIVCPRCIERRVPQGQCQITIQQKNRMWHLDRKRAGEPILFGGQVYISAGDVMESERFSCPACGWAARIDKNKIHPVG